MILRNIIIILVLSISYHVNGQNSDSLIVNRIDSRISLIPIDSIKSDYFITIQENGRIDKRVLGLFRKQIGRISSDIIYHDTLIYSIANVYRYKRDNKILSETFYYKENLLITYVKRLSINPELDKEAILKHEIYAYFDKNRLIKLTETINDNYVFDFSEQLKVTGIANAEIIITLKSIKQLNNYAPGPSDVRLRRDINE